MDFKHYSISDVGRVRQANEDNCGDRMTANGYVFVVCDGMGGHVGGATASKIAVESILDFFENPVQNIYVGINDAFKFANSQVFQAAQQDPSLKGMGTTGTILVMNNEACYIGHVGDSRIYLKSDGKLNRLTKDHSFVQTLVDQGIISDDDAEKHPKKNQILEALGIKVDVNPTVCQAPIQPKPGDCFLMCSDGLNGMIHDSEIDRLINPEDVEHSCRSLISAANESGGKDNITATLVTITESPYMTSVFTHYNPLVPQSETIVETIVEEPDPKRANRQKVILWSAIGFGIAMLALLIIFMVPGMFGGEDETPPPGNSNGNNGSNPLTEKDSICDSVDSLYMMLISEEGVMLFDNNGPYKLKGEKYYKKVGGEWKPKWHENMDKMYSDINEIFKGCDEITDELPEKPKKNPSGNSTNSTNHVSREATKESDNAPGEDNNDEDIQPSGDTEGDKDGTEEGGTDGNNPETTTDTDDDGNN